jgi:D-beta-D-heptose 7-phosphate kinase / D-beta-D-heptose 1-phosphate adenosyltransferase
MMADHLPDLIDSFVGRRVLVVGDAMLDSYLEGTCGRMCPEAPVPVVDVCRSAIAAGGAANVAANLRALGADVGLLGVVGDDAEGGDLARAIGDSGVSITSLIRQRGRKTLAKKRVTAGGQVVCRVDQGDAGPIDEEVEARLVRALADSWQEAEAVVISDYGYGVLTANVIAAVATLQRQSPRPIVADSKRLPAFREVGLTAAKPNYREALRLLGLEYEAGHPRERADRLAAFGPRLLELAGARIAALTLDTEGAVVFERDRPPYRTYAEPRPQSFACGAGDTYLAGLVLALAAGAATPTAAEIAAAAAAIVVGKSGTAICTDLELRSRLSGGTKIVDRQELCLRLEAERSRGRRIVLTNGCFDILHRGHVTYLARSKALGDILVVGVNSDASIRRLKGPARPINALEDRLHVLAALSSVDVLIPFDESTPHELIRAVRPHFFVKGGDYTRDRLPEAALVEEFGGEVRILSFLADRSTTGLIDKIRTTDRHGELHLNELNGCR